MRIASRICVGLCAALCAASSARAVEHPFMLWTKEEAARMRRQVETAPWGAEALKHATARVAALANARNPGAAAHNLLLFQYGVLGQRDAGQAIKAKLLKDVASGEFTKVDAAYGFDVVYDLLTPEERQRVRKAFTEAVEAKLAWKAPFNRWNWLPNLAYGGYCRLHVLAAATGDEALIRRIFNSPHGYKWYLDEYLSDLGFYNEELTKMISAEYMLPWCWAMDRLGLSELGFGYQGRQGATFRGHVESLLRVGMPRVDLGTDLPHYPRLVMGDTRGSFGEEYFAYCFQQSNVPGALATGPAGDWTDDRTHRLRWWLEYLHAKWPDAGYDYFLAGYRLPGEERYWCSLRFGLPPIDPKTVKPPPAPSGVYPGRGLVVLRADESPAYWESAAPAVGMRLATPYAHHVQDSFTLMGLFAFNRPIYINPGRTTDRYTGVDPWFSNSIRSHCAVMVDGREPQHLVEPAATRHDFSSTVKFAAARAKGIYAGVDQTRALMLTREYLLDASHLASARARDCLWQVHTLGHLCPDNPSAWASSRRLAGVLPDLGNEQSATPNDTWSVTAVQTTAGAHPQFSGLGERWFKRRVGVRMTMLGESPTHAHTGWTPVLPNGAEWNAARQRYAFGEEEPARVAIVATRVAASTMFVALHEPFEGTPRLADIQRLAGDANSFVVRVIGDRFTDYAMVRFGDDAQRPADLKWAHGAVRFADYGFVRIADDRVDIEGGITGLVLPMGSTARQWFVKGKPMPAPPADGPCAAWGHALDRPAATPAAPRAAQRPGPLAVRWHPPTELCLPLGGKRTTTLKLRNNGQTTLGATLAIFSAGGLEVRPQSVDLAGMAPGDERDILVTVASSKAAPHQLHRVSIAVAQPAGLPAQCPDLVVAHGVTSSGREQIGNGFRVTIHSPRYLARYWIMDSGGAAELLDPQGYRRLDATGHSAPHLLQPTTQPDGKVVDQRVTPRKQPYFNPLLIEGESGAPGQLYDGGWHVHGYQADLEHWWTEDWMLVRHRRAKASDLVAFHWPWITRGGIIMGRNDKLAAQLKPGRAWIVDGGGKRLELTKGLPADVSIRAVYNRPAGYDHGYLLLYMPGAKVQRGQVYHPGDSLVGFTFAGDAEADELVARWQANPPSSVVSPEITSRYRGGFGAKPVPAEP